jgi:peptidoglycan/LPS O-acetylase OafA/YrhL
MRRWIVYLPSGCNRLRHENSILAAAIPPEQTNERMSEKKSFRYVPELDGIRGIFCWPVVIAHTPLMLAKLPVAWEMMQLFYILSGYLITSILLHEKDQPLKVYLKNFYIRRVLKIFPLYFLYIFLVWLLVYATRNVEAMEFSGMAEEFRRFSINLFTFTYNFREIIIIISGEEARVAPIFSHLWSISLEEQFYLVLPFVVYFLDREQLKKLMIAVIIITPVLKFAAFEWLSTYTDNKGDIALAIFHNSVLQADAFAWGILMAILPFSKIKRPGTWGLLLFIVSIAIIKYDGWFICKEQIGKDPFVYLFKPELLGYNYQFLYAFSLINASFFLMVLSVVSGKSQLKILSHPWAVFMGKVSYGIYVYHFGLVFIVLVPIILVINAISPGLYKILLNPFPGLPAQWLIFVVYAAAVVFISHISFELFEKPFLKLKNKFR